MQTTVTTNRVAQVTADQIARCSKAYDCQTKQNYYLVENESGKFGEDGELILYKVTYNARHFQCTCLAGQHGFAHCREYCKHIYWALACEAAYRREQAELAEQERKQAEARRQAEERKAAAQERKAAAYSARMERSYMRSVEQLLFIRQAEARSK